MTFKPSEVRMWRGILPLIGTFGRAETEFAAALMVMACRAKGDAWESVIPVEVGLAMREQLKEGGELYHLNGNPFCPCPDMHELVAKGFAVFEGEGKGPPIRFTEKGLGVLAKTVAS